MKIERPKRDYKKRGRSAALFTAVSVLAGIVSVLLAVYMISLLWDGVGFAGLLVLALGIVLCQLVKAACYAAALWKAHDFAYSSLLNIWAVGARRYLRLLGAAHATILEHNKRNAYHQFFR
jgi:ATP-binding cassette subfamily B protein